MQIAGLLHGSKLLRLVGFEHAEILGPDASEREIKSLIDRHGSVFIKPLFKVGIGKKGKAGLVVRAHDVQTALAEKERLFFAEHTVGNIAAKANGVTYEGAVPSDHEVYFSITDSTRFRAPTITLTHQGGVDIEDLPRDKVAEIPFEALTGLKAFVIANALADLKAPLEIISPLVQALPRLWDLMRGYGVSMVELNPIRLKPQGGRLVPIACDFKCAFDRDDPRWERLGLPADFFHEEQSDFEMEVNSLRTHQGQSDVFVINPNGTILAPTFGGGANSLVTEVLGDDAIISTDFGGNPPYEKMKALATICFRHWLRRANILLVIGGRSNNTDIMTTFRGIADALREHINTHGPTPLFVVIGRGGPNLVSGMGAMAEALDELQLPYRFFGSDSAISEVVKFAQLADQWMKTGGFQANPEMRASYLGAGWELARVRGTRFNTGDGIKSTLAIGAAPYGNWSGCHAVGWDFNAPEFGDLDVGDGFQKHSYPFGIMVNANGRRFVDEGADFRNYTYAKYGRVILDQPGNFAWQIFDAKVAHLLRDEYRIKQVTRVAADTLEELATKLEGVDPTAFLEEVAAYNAAVDADIPFNPNVKDGRGTRGLSVPKSNWANRLDEGPFQAFQVGCGITFTFGGLRVNEQAQVMDVDITPIEGLYAAGELVGGIFYFNYPGGTGLMSGAVFDVAPPLAILMANPNAAICAENGGRFG